MWQVKRCPQEASDVQIEINITKCLKIEKEPHYHRLSLEQSLAEFLLCRNKF